MNEMFIEIMNLYMIYSFYNKTITKECIASRMYRRCALSCFATLLLLMISYVLNVYVFYYVIGRDKQKCKKNWKMQHEIRDLLVPTV